MEFKIKEYLERFDKHYPSLPLPNQPERSKREDAIKECQEMGHVNTWMPKDQTLCMRCGALNSMET